MKKNALSPCLLALAFLAGIAGAETLSEVSLKEANFQGLNVEGALKEECTNIIFIKEPISEQLGVFTVFSMHALFAPASEGSASIKVFLNKTQEPIAELKPESFRKEWTRIMIPKAGMLEKNGLKICAKTSNSITSIKVLEDSKMGSYKMPVFELEKTVESTRPIVGKEMKVTLKAKNTGSEAGKASVKYRDLELNIAQITKGDSEFEGVIQAGESIQLSYYVKPKYALQMDLSSAILEFENIFGEKETVLSNRPMLLVQEPEFKIKPTLSIEEQKTFQPGEQVKITLTARNDGLNDLENVSIKLSAPENTMLSKDSFENLNFKAGEAKTFAITASSLEEGSKQVECTAEYTDYALVNSKCAPMTIEFEKPKQNPLLGLAIALVVIGALIYAYIYRPEKKKEQ